MTAEQKKDIIKSIVVLTAICLVVSAALAVVNSFTAPVSAANAFARENAARLAVIPDATAFESVENVTFPPEIIGAYVGKNDGGDTLGYVFTVTGTGFGGPITIICGIDTHDKIIKCSTLDVSSETKTLGGQTESESYTSQYTGQTIDLTTVETISGATITSKAYQDCVRMAFKACNLIKEAAA